MSNTPNFRRLSNLRLLKEAFAALGTAPIPAYQNGTTTLLALIRTNKAGFKAAGLEVSKTDGHFRFNHRKQFGAPATMVARWCGQGFDVIEPLLWPTKTTTGRRLAARVETLIRKYETVPV